MSKLLILAILTASLALNACTRIAKNIPGIYTLDVFQGNAINQEIIDQLRPNMNKRQVLYIMGTPMLRDIFHPQRWDYIFSEQLGGGLRLQKRALLYFKDDKLVSVQGDFRPSNTLVHRPSHDVTVYLPERQLEKNMASKVVEMFTADTAPPVEGVAINVDETDDMDAGESADSEP